MKDPWLLNVKKSGGGGRKNSASPTLVSIVLRRISDSTTTGSTLDVDNIEAEIDPNKKLVQPDDADLIKTLKQLSDLNLFNCEAAKDTNLAEWVVQTQTSKPSIKASMF